MEMDRDHGRVARRAANPRRRMVVALAASFGGTALARPVGRRRAPPVVGVLAFTAMLPA